MKRSQQNIKDYINSFGKFKKIVFYLSVIFLFFEFLSPILYLIGHNNVDLFFEGKILSFVIALFSILFYALDFFKIYSFLFPFVFIIINLAILYKNKYNNFVIVIDYLFQIINPVTMSFFVTIYISVMNAQYPL
jgi:hypothetical protein